MADDPVHYDDWVAALTTATIAGTETLLVVQSATTKKTTPAALAAYVIDTLYAAAAVDPVVAGDDFVLYRGTDEKKVDVDVLASYIVATGWTAAAEADPVVTEDMILVKRGSTIYQIDVEALSDYVFNLGPECDNAVAFASGDEFFFYRGATPLLGTIDLLTSYTLVTAWGAVTPTITTLNSSDTFLVGQSAVSKKITLANIETQIVTDKKATILDIYGYGQATLAASDEFLVNQSNGATIKKTSLTALETKLHADFGVYAAALTDASTVADADEFYILNGGSGADPQNATALEVYTYIAGKLWDAPTDLGAITGTDTVLVNRSGTMYESTVTEIATFINASLQATVLNISGLDHATIADANLLLVCQGTTGKHALASEMAAYVHAGFTAYTAGLDAITAPTDTDKLFCIQTTGKYVTPLVFWDYTKAKIEATALALAAPTLTLAKVAVNASPIAAAGSTYANATEISAHDIVEISSDSAAKGVKLLTGVAGQDITLVLTSATACELYPATGGTLSGLAANAPVTIAAKHIVRCMCLAADTWRVADLGAELAA